MQPVLTRPQPARLRFGRDTLAAVGVIAGCGLLIALLLVLVRDPATVPRLTVVNGTGSVVEVEASDADGNSWVALGAVDPASQRRFSEVLDQGDEWRFRFTSGRAVGGEDTVARDELAADGWSLTIPDHVARRLEAEGAVTATPR